ncbi:MAG: dTDP-4-dehydrorhamnose 3,5-epimerase [Sphingosinicella sp.]
MDFIASSIAGAFEIRLRVHEDARGRFKRHYCRREFEVAGLPSDFVQVNHSVTRGRGTIRGLHYQSPPAAEAKLVSCTFGRAFDVAVDLRRDSPTFLEWAHVELDDATMFFIPKGCAHGFQALTDETHLLYMHSDYYAPELEAGLRFDDPRVGINWPLAPSGLSPRDGAFASLDPGFEGLEL